VFKNIFEQTKFVESYRSSDIETELHLDRKKLIFLAHLLGSDYAAGVHGIGADKSTRKSNVFMKAQVFEYFGAAGIVNALEVLAAFPGENGLREFRKWANTLGNDPKPPAKQRVTFSDDEEDEDEVQPVNSVDPAHFVHCLSGICHYGMQEARVQHLQAEFKYKHRNQKKNYIFEDDFPRGAVTREYLHPQADRSPAPFSWSGLQYVQRQRLCIIRCMTGSTHHRKQPAVMICIGRYDAMLEWCDRTLGWCVFFVLVHGDRVNIDRVQQDN
jgi:DNA excision repair protein ERCC-5